MLVGRKKGSGEQSQVRGLYWALFWVLDRVIKEK
jgi:hypothetical protein